MRQAPQVDPARPVLIAGPTASGKSALAMEIAARDGGVIVNADALQVYGNWRLLSARPSAEEEAALPHRLFGHVGRELPYSTGAWLREVADLLAGPERLIIVGGTGLYFSALTEGLVEIPPMPRGHPRRGQRPAPGGSGRDGGAVGRAHRRAHRPGQPRPGAARLGGAARHGPRPGRLAGRHPRPLLPPEAATRLLLEAPKDWLSPRIERRFDLMLAGGALEEARANLDGWDPALPSSKAIGGPELIAHLLGEISLDEARERAIISSRRYAKRQRTWFRARMRDWHALTAS